MQHRISTIGRVKGVLVPRLGAVCNVRGYRESHTMSSIYSLSLGTHGFIADRFRYGSGSLEIGCSQQASRPSVDRLLPCTPTTAPGGRDCAKKLRPYIPVLNSDVMVKNSVPVTSRKNDSGGSPKR